jgi:hypothetical protein
MSKVYVHQMNIRRWFPPNDRYAACVARLCILREDFDLEMSGLYATSIKTLDRHSTVWRRLYFWRNLVKTLWEIRRTLETLNTVPEFKRVLKRQPSGTRNEFGAMVRKLETDQSLVQNIRDALGGHVLQRTLEQALNDMPLDRFSYLEVGRNLKTTHYKFAGELVVEMLLADVPEARRQAEAERHFRTIAKLLPVFALTDIIFTMYVSSRNLLD